MKPEPDEIDRIMACATEERTIWLRVNKGKVELHEVGWIDDSGDHEEVHIIFASADYAKASAELWLQQRLELVRAMRADLRAAGYAIVLDEAQLLEKGDEAGVKIHD